MANFEKCANTNAIIGDARIYENQFVANFDTISILSPDIADSINGLHLFYKKVLATVVAAPMFCDICVLTKEAKHISRIQAYFASQYTGKYLFDTCAPWLESPDGCEQWYHLPTMELQSIVDNEQFADIPTQRIPKFLFTLHVSTAIFRRKAADVCFALQDLQLPVLLTVLILDELMETDVRMWLKWQIAARIKHFHVRLDESL